MSIKNKIQLRKYAIRLSQYTSFICDVFDLFSKFYEKKNIVTFSGFAVGALNKFIGYYVKDSDSMFNDLKVVFPKCLYCCLYDTIKQNGQRIKVEPVEPYRDTIEYIVHNYKGVEIILSNFVQDDHIASVNVNDSDFDKFIKIHNDFFWDVFNTNSLLLVNEKSYIQLALKNDNLVVPMSTNKSKEYVEYIKKCFDAGINRSMLFYGPPGSGKSCMVKAICNDLNLRTLRLRAEDVSKIDNNRLFDVISFLKPDVVIVEDVDKSKLNAGTLELYAWLKSNVKLIMSTVNNKSSLGKAMLRPGRFDEYVLVDKIDDSIIYNLLGSENKKLYDTVKDWPVAYIDELKTRFKYMSKEKAIQSIQELDLRVKEQDKSPNDSSSSDEDKEDDESFL